MTRLGKVVAAGALVAVPLAFTAIPEKSAQAQVYVSPYAYGYPACNPYYGPYCGYGWYGYPAGWGWGGWWGRGWGHGGFRGGFRGGGFHGGGFHGGGFHGRR